MPTTPLHPSQQLPTQQPDFFQQTQAARWALGDRFGLTQFGVNYTRIPPGAISALRHCHSHQDEAVFILAGHPTLRTNAGETPLAPGMFVAFKAGNGDAHQLLNRTNEDVICLEIGDRHPEDRVSYPDDSPEVIHAALHGS